MGLISVMVIDYFGIRLSLNLSGINENFNKIKKHLIHFHFKAGLTFLVRFFESLVRFIKVILIH